MTPDQVSPAEKERRIRAAVAHYLPLLHLAKWQVRVNIYPDRESMGAKEDQSAAACSAQSEYRVVDLDFALAEVESERLERDVLHELCHALNWPLIHFGDWMVEQFAPENPAAEEFGRYLMESCASKLEGILWEALPRPLA